MFHPLLAAYEDIEAREKAVGISPGAPIVIRLDDLHADPDGFRLDPRLVAYFSSWVWRGQSQGSINTYAPIFGPFLRWLATQREISVWDVTEEEMLDWKTLRTDVSENPEGAIAGATWNKEVAALDRFFKWAVDQRHMNRNPLDRLPNRGEIKGVGKYRATSREEKRRSGSSFVRKDARSYKVDWVAPATYGIWRDVALGGFLLSAGTSRGKVALGAEDKSFRGRNLSRNMAFYDALYFTGMRPGETCLLTTLELPDLMTGNLTSLRISRAINKSHRDRTIDFAPGAALRIARYLQDERQEAVARARRDGRYSGTEWVTVTDEHVRQGVVFVKLGNSTTWTSADDLTPAIRRRLLVSDKGGRLEPALLWLTESGLPMGEDDFEKVLERANDRFEAQSQAIGLNPYDRPYPTASTMRFSFALVYLILLHQQIDRTYGYNPLDVYDYGRYEFAYRAVQEQLGHLELSTTRGHYLQAVQDQRNAELLRGAAGDVEGVFRSLAERMDMVWALPTGDADD